jgi:hypothetical protein
MRARAAPSMHTMHDSERKNCLRHRGCARCARCAGFLWKKIRNITTSLAFGPQARVHRPGEVARRNLKTAHTLHNCCGSETKQMGSHAQNPDQPRTSGTVSAFRYACDPLLEYWVHLTGPSQQPAIALSTIMPASGADPSSLQGGFPVWAALPADRFAPVAAVLEHLPQR